MDGIFDRADPRRCFREIIGPTGAAGGTDFESLELPSPDICSVIAILCIGSGAGGGGGGGNATGTTRSGGGGGAAGAITYLQIPRIWLPDRVHVLVGYGGLGTAGSTGGASASNGGNGRRSRVAIHPDTTAGNIICVSGTADPTGGGGGGNGAGGAGGTGGTAATSSVMPLGGYGSAVSFIAGQDGQASGGGGADTGDVTISAAKAFFLGGCGGGSVSSGNVQRAAGGYAAIASTPFSAIAGGAATGKAGSPGFQWGSFPAFYGGTGGGPGDATTNGGDGGGCANVPGVGGGGGAGGTTAGGKGGDGGPGLIIITGW